jgi:glycosyltransferase involved in cell wall biosynthesis
MSMLPRAHIMHVIDGLEYGGTETVLLDLLSIVMASGFRVTVCYMQPGPLVDRYSALGIPLIRIPWSRRVDPRLVTRIWSVLRSDPPDILHTHLFKSDFHGQIAARLARVPIVLSTLHNTNQWAANPVLGRVYGLVMRLADRLIVLSDEMREFFVSHARIPRSHFVTIHNAIPLSRFEGHAPGGTRVRQELGIRVEAPVIGFIGRLDPQKDHVTFLRAAARVLEAMPAARFLIVGDGSKRPALEALAQSLNLGASAVFCGFRDDVADILAGLDMLVLSTHHEGVPVVVLEGMASSIPIVATATRGVLSVIHDGENGLLVPAVDPAALATACLRLLGDPGLRRDLGRAGRAYVEAHHGIEATASQTVQLYQSLLQAAQGAV